MEKRRRFRVLVGFFRLAVSLSMLSACQAEEASTAQGACELKYPIVLSHHWGVRKICPDDTDSEDCEVREAAKNCAEWVTDPVNQDQDCAAWLVPEEERSLPPRNVNVHDSALRRNMDEYHRYFSAEIVERLEECGNAVYIADKPPFASYDVRARSLRNTVLEALAETGASKVNITGMSQGSQDARFLAAELPVSDTDPSLGMMRDKIASIVTVVGEDGGAESASLALEAIYAASKLGSGWGDYGAISLWPADAMDEILWEDSSVAGIQNVLVEGYDASSSAEYAMTDDDEYRTFLRSLTVNGTTYMQGEPGAWLHDDASAWDDLRAYLRMSESGWSDLVTPADENGNGIEYFSYAAEIHSWDSEVWGDVTVYLAIKALHGTNDGYVILDSQTLDRRGYPNFHHVKTMSGSAQGRGYHHMFFSGRADDAYQPEAGDRDTSGYGGSSANFFEQVARDLRAAGF